MPTCKNDPKKSYKGDEPSPKGFGYCAHAEKIGVMKRGKDGKVWIVKKFEKSKKWVLSDFYKKYNEIEKKLKLLLKKSPVDFIFKSFTDELKKNPKWFNNFNDKIYFPKIIIEFKLNEIGQKIGQYEFKKCACESEFYKYVINTGSDTGPFKSLNKILTQSYYFDIDPKFKISKNFKSECKKYQEEYKKFNSNTNKNETKKLIDKNLNIDCSKFAIYEKKEKSLFGYTSTSILEGIEKRKGYIYKYIDFNLFEKEETKIPDGFKKRPISKIIKSYNCDLNKELLKKDNELYKKIKENLKGYKSYFTHDNGGRLFLVYIKNNDVHIYKISNKYYIRNSNWSYINANNNKCFYNEFVKAYKCKKVFIGKSPKCIMTEFSGGYGPKFDGNSILLQIDSNKYVFVGHNIYEFKIDDTINEYYSPVGNNDVPYPVALGSKNTYFMLDQTYVSNDKFKDLTKKNKIDLYSYYYGHSGNEKLEKYAKNMKKKIIDT